jgi:hypothetical protein
MHFLKDNTPTYEALLKIVRGLQKPTFIPVMESTVGRKKATISVSEVVCQAFHWDTCSSLADDDDPGLCQHLENG